MLEIIIIAAATMKFTDAAPIRNTCPVIDSVIDKIQEAIKYAKYLNVYAETEISEEYSSSIIKELKDALPQMEAIREANETLRLWGNEEYVRAEEIEKEMEYLKRQSELV